METGKGEHVSFADDSKPSSIALGQHDELESVHSKDAPSAQGLPAYMGTAAYVSLLRMEHTGCSSRFIVHSQWRRNLCQTATRKILLDRLDGRMITSPPPLQYILPLLPSLINKLRWMKMNRNQGRALTSLAQLCNDSSIVACSILL